MSYHTPSKYAVTDAVHNSGDEDAAERKRARRQAKKLKKENAAGDGNAAPQFLPVPKDIANGDLIANRMATESEGGEEKAVESSSKSSRSGKKKAKRADANTDEAALSNSQKRKAQRREDRNEKRKKRKRNDDTPAVEAATVEGNAAEPEARTPHEDTQGKAAPKAKKVSAARAQKKASMGERRKLRAAEARAQDAGLDQTNPNRVHIQAKHWVAGEVHGEDPPANGTSDEAKSAKSQRFIAFIGNLPYSADSTSITQHFSAIAPFSVRAPTDPKTGKSKGYAFLEFEGYDKMKSCLKLYHHSTFGEGKGARKINVELTAGGGGKGENRKAKIKEKNEKLTEERRKAHEEEAKARKGSAKKTGPTAVDGAAEGEDDDNADVHPSRRKRMGL